MLHWSALHRLCFATVRVRLVLERADADVAEAGAARVAPRAFSAVHLQADVAARGVTLARVGEVNRLHAVEPRGDVRRLAGDARTQFVPAVLAIRFLPVFVLNKEAASRRRVEAA